MDSLESQTRRDFDVLIANDGLCDVEPALEARKLNVALMDVSGSISANRRNLILRAIDLGYENIIFCDSDDVLSANRIEVCMSLLDQHELVANDLAYMERKSDSLYFCRRLGSDGKISLRHLLKGNMMGLTNVAVKADCVKKSPALVSGESVAFDWYLWSSVLLDTKYAFFTTESYTRYRRHENTSADLMPAINKTNVHYIASVKCQHYRLMAKLDALYAELADEFSWLLEKIGNDSFFSRYIRLLHENPVENPFWWETVRAPSEVGLA